MPNPAAPAPPPAACLGAAGRAARRHRIIERALRGWSTGTISGAVDLGGARSSGGRSSCARVDPARARLRWQTARLDERAGSGDGDKARAAARGGRTAARRRAPRGFQFACNSLICLDRARNPFPNIAAPKGFVGRGGAQTPIWVVEAPEAGGGGRRAKG